MREDAAPADLPFIEQRTSILTGRARPCAF
jgi:hypothetical protein